MTKIDEYLHDNPRLLSEFMQHGDILRELRRRFEIMIAEGDVVSRYLLTKALQETIQVSAETAKEILRERIRERGVMVLPSVKDQKVH